MIKPDAPHEWVIAANDMLYSVHVPIHPDGSIEEGNATRQTIVTLTDLRLILDAARARVEDVVLVQIYLTSLSHKPLVDKVYKGYSTSPLPVRVCVAVSELPPPGTTIEILATTALSR